MPAHFKNWIIYFVYIPIHGAEQQRKAGSFQAPTNNERRGRHWAKGSSAVGWLVRVRGGGGGGLIASLKDLDIYVR